MSNAGSVRVRIPSNHSSGAGLLILAVTVVGVFVSLRPHYRALTALATMTIAMQAFHYLRYPARVWHTSVLFVTWVGLVWLLRSREQLSRSAVVGLLLIPCALGGVKAVLASKAHPPCTSELAAAWIERHGLQNEEWVGFPVFPVLAISARLDRPFYFGEYGGRTTYARWGEHQPFLDWELGREIARLYPEKTIYLATLGDLQQRWPDAYRTLGEVASILKLAHFQGSATGNFALYRPQVRNTVRSVESLRK